jgi:sialidase-1
MLKARTRIVGLAVAGMLAGLAIAAEPKQPEIMRQGVICKQPGRYIGWPTICKTRQGELLAVFSGDRDAHVCPWGKTQMVRSADNGKTWSQTLTINNTPLDDRDAGIIQTQKGTLIVSWFTSLAFLSRVNPDWQRHIDKLGPETRRQWIGSWIRRSTDDGQSWGDPVKVAASAPHGPIDLKDGRLLYVGNRFEGGLDGNYTCPANDVLESRDDGATWQRIATIAIPKNERQDHYWEPHVVECADGKLVAMFRYDPQDKDQRILRQTESDDGGKTWTTPHPTGIWGSPPHLIRLKNDWLLVTYGVRREPYGEYACVSRDNGKTWDIENQIMIHAGTDWDLGYPASVQLDDGSIFTVYYQTDQPGEKTSLMGARWRLPGL